MASNRKMTIDEQVDYLIQGADYGDERLKGGHGYRIKGTAAGS